VTLAVVACWPWGAVRKAFPVPNFEQIVILATDSRFSFGSSGTSPLDDGRKAYYLGPHCAMVFAGDVLAAESTVRLLKRYINEVGCPSETSMLSDLPRILKGNHIEHQHRSLQKDRPPFLLPLQILLGLTSAEGRACGVEFSSTCKYEPIPFMGIHAVGEASAVQRFHQVIRELDQARVRNNQLDPKALNCAGDIVTGIQSALDDAPTQSTVGGQIQCLVLSKDRYVAPKWSRMKVERPDPDEPWFGRLSVDPDHPSQRDLWEELTAPPDSVRSARYPRSQS
jgi:hypothetical protein